MENYENIIELLQEQNELLRQEITELKKRHATNVIVNGNNNVCALSGSNITMVKQIDFAVCLLEELKQQRMMNDKLLNKLLS